MVCSTPSSSVYTMRSGSLEPITGPGNSWLAESMDFAGDSCKVECACLDMLERLKQSLLLCCIKSGEMEACIMYRRAYARLGIAPCI